jgi:hypothetical protein
MLLSFKKHTRERQLAVGRRQRAENPEPGTLNSELGT